MQKYNNSPTLKKKKLVFYLSEKDFLRKKTYEPSPRYDIAAKEAKRPTWVSSQTSSWP